MGHQPRVGEADQERPADPAAKQQAGNLQNQSYRVTGRKADDMYAGHWQPRTPIELASIVPEGVGRATEGRRWATVNRPSSSSPIITQFARSGWAEPVRAVPPASQQREVAGGVWKPAASGRAKRRGSRPRTSARADARRGCGAAGAADRPRWLRRDGDAHVAGLVANLQPQIRPSRHVAVHPPRGAARVLQARGDRVPGPSRLGP